MRYPERSENNLVVMRRVGTYQYIPGIVQACLQFQYLHSIACGAIALRAGPSDTLFEFARIVISCLQSQR